MVLMGKIVVLLVKILVADIKMNIFFIKHDDDVLGEIGHGIIDGLKEEITGLIGEMQNG